MDNTCLSPALRKLDGKRKVLTPDLGAMRQYRKCHAQALSLWERLILGWDERKHFLQLNIFVAKVALLLLHAAGAGFASPAILVARPLARSIEWLPVDNQTVYRIGGGESRSFELNATATVQSPVFFTISPCAEDLRWSLKYGSRGSKEDHFSTIREGYSGETISFSLFVSHNNRYILQLSSTTGSAAAVSVRGEAPRTVRMRLRVKSRRRLAANWSHSPIDPQRTTYCIVASYRKNYTSLCAAQHEIKSNRQENPISYNNCSNRLTDQSDEHATRLGLADTDNKVETNSDLNLFERSFRNIYRKKKFSRSTTVSDDDPVVACVGERTHHLFENLDQSRTYFVSLYGVAVDRSAGSLLATGSVKPKTSTAKRLRENVSFKTEMRGKTVFYFKTTIGAGGGIWLAVTTCGGAVDVEVVVRGKRLHTVKNIDPHAKFFVLAPTLPSSIQESSEDTSVQFDSSSEEARIRYVIKVTPSLKDREGSVGVELTVSTTRWGMNIPELSEDGNIVREIRQRRSCRSVDIAFLPAYHNSDDVIRYCIGIRESGSNSDGIFCKVSRRTKLQCINSLHSSTKVIVQKITGLKPGRKYALQVIASGRGNSVPYNVLLVDTNLSCRIE